MITDEIFINLKNMTIIQIKDVFTEDLRLRQQSFLQNDSL